MTQNEVKEFVSPTQVDVSKDYGREVISVDRNSQGEKRLGRAGLLIAEGVRITLLERSRVRNAAAF